jgi:hypothetical protein
VNATKRRIQIANPKGEEPQDAASCRAGGIDYGKFRADNAPLCEKGRNPRGSIVALSKAKKQNAALREVQYSDGILKRSAISPRQSEGQSAAEDVQNPLVVFISQHTEVIGGIIRNKGLAPSRRCSPVETAGT